MHERFYKKQPLRLLYAQNRFRNCAKDLKSKERISNIIWNYYEDILPDDNLLFSISEEIENSVKACNLELEYKIMRQGFSK